MKNLLKNSFILLFFFVFSSSIFAQYCLPSANCTLDDGIREFRLGSLINISDCEASIGVDGYGDFTDLTGMDLGQLTPYVVTLRSNFMNNQASIWIDSDNSDSFESSELVLTDFPIGTDLVMTEIVIPNIPIGSYRMRVMSTYNAPSSTDPCELQTEWGETEDYTVNIIAPASCLPVSGVQSTNINSEGADISWTEHGTAMSWDLEIVESQNTPTGNPTSGYENVSNPISLIGFEQLTSYLVYVRSNCGGGDVSVWSEPISFTTECGTFMPPHYEPFSVLMDTPICWEEATAGDLTTGPMEYGSGQWSIEFFSNTPFNNARKINLWEGGVTSDWLISPPFSLMGGSPYQLEFDLAFTPFGEQDSTRLGSDDKVAITISADNGETWTTLQVWTTQDVVSPIGEKKIYDLSPYQNMTVIFAFWGSDGIIDDQEDNDIFIDNFFVREPPTCLEIANLQATQITGETAIISWVDTTSTNWDIEVGVAGFTPTGIPTSGYDDISNPTILTGLDSQTDYEVYVRADCGMDNVSDVGFWIGPLEFTTECQIFVAPYIADFNQSLLPCWQEARAGDPNTGTSEFGPSSWVPDGFANIGFSGAIRIKLDDLGDNDWFISPTIEIPTNGLYQVEFDFSITVSGFSAPSLLGSDDIVIFVVSDDNMENWEIIEIWDEDSVIDHDGERKKYTLEDYVGKQVNFALWASEGMVDDPVSNDVFIDNFEVILVSETVPLAFNVTAVSPTCKDFDNGMIDLTPLGGLAPYIYDWSNGASTEDISNLLAGSYSCVVTDAENNSITVSANLIDPDEINSNATIVDESFDGANDGSIVLDANGGTGEFSYQWDSGEQTSSLIDLTDGTYCVTITDSNSCSLEECYEVLTGTVSTNNIDDLQIFKLYPNPVSNQEVWVELQFESIKDLDIQLINSIGQTVYQNQMENIREWKLSFDTQNLPTGLYFVKITSLKNQQVMAKRLLKQ